MAQDDKTGRKLCAVWPCGAYWPIESAREWAAPIYVDGAQMAEITANTRTELVKGLQSHGAYVGSNVPRVTLRALSGRLLAEWDDDSGLYHVWINRLESGRYSIESTIYKNPRVAHGHAEHYQTRELDLTNKSNAAAFAAIKVQVTRARCDFILTAERAKTEATQAAERAATRRAYLKRCLDALNGATAQELAEIGARGYFDSTQRQKTGA